MTNILVAGGTDGLGLEIVKQLITDESKHVSILGRNDQNLTDISQKITFHHLDITKEQDVQSFAENFQDQIDILIISVGIYGHGGLTSFSYSQIRESLEANLLGHIFLTRAMAPKLNDNARIISINSISGVNATKDRSLLCAAKWGLRGFYNSLTEELKDKGIMITQVFPGYFDSNYMDKVGIPKDRSKAINKTVLAEQIVSVCNLPAHVYVPELQIKNIAYA